MTGVLIHVTLSDSDAIKAVQTGDIEAFAVLVNRYQDRLMRYAAHLLGNRHDAEEAVQETFVRAYRALPRYEHREQCSAWLLRILINRCRTAASRRREHEPLEAADFEFTSDEDPVERLAVRDELARAMAQLTDEQREAIALRFGEDLSFDEMAVVTGAGVSALKMRVQRACARLRVLMEGHRAAV